MKIYGCAIHSPDIFLLTKGISAGLSGRDVVGPAHSCPCTLITNGIIRSCYLAPCVEEACGGGGPLRYTSSATHAKTACAPSLEIIVPTLSWLAASGERWPGSASLNFANRNQALDLLREVSAHIARRSLNFSHQFGAAIDNGDQIFKVPAGVKIILAPAGEGFELRDAKIYRGDQSNL